MKQVSKNSVVFTDTNGALESRTPSAEHDKIKIELADGHTLIMGLNELSEGIQHQALLHGLKQKLVDSVAGKQGKEASDALEATAEMLRSEAWTRAREGGGGSNTTLLLEALMNIFKKSKEECLQVIDNLDKDQRKELSAKPQIAAEILRIRAKKAEEKAKDLAKQAKGEESFNPFDI